jgi:hypothetical protein
MQNTPYVPIAAVAGVAGPRSDMDFVGILRLRLGRRCGLTFGVGGVGS